MMTRKIKEWTIRDLRTRYFTKIGFPEFQREYSVWDEMKRQQLIDSILRNLDIGTLYFAIGADGILDCIDGRQRIVAIMAYMGKEFGEEESVAGAVHVFGTRAFEEVGSVDASFHDLPDGTRYESSDFNDRREQFDNYSLRVVLLEYDQEDDTELRRQFLRLQLGQLLTSAEKLRAMAGDMRDAIFGESKKGSLIEQTPFVRSLAIPRRRFAREQVLAQILVNAFLVERHSQDPPFARARFTDLQEFLKDHATLTTADKRTLSEVREVLSMCEEMFPPDHDKNIFGNRAMALTTFLVIWTMTPRELDKSLFPLFMTDLLASLRTYDDTVRLPKRQTDLIEAITKASVEKSSIEARHRIVKAMFAEYRKLKRLSW